MKYDLYILGGEVWVEEEMGVMGNISLLLNIKLIITHKND